MTIKCQDENISIALYQDKHIDNITIQFSKISLY